MQILFELGTHIHFLAFSIWIGAAIYRLVALTPKAREAIVPEFVKKMDYTYFKIAGVCVTALFFTGMLNICHIFMDQEPVQTEYRFMFFYKIFSVVGVLVIFFIDLSKYRDGIYNHVIAIFETMMILHTGVLGYVLWRLH